MTFNLYNFCILIMYFPTLTIFIILIIRYNFINKFAIVFNIGFFIFAIYISIYYIQEFIYFLNLENINIIESNVVLPDCEYSSNDMVNSDQNKKMLFNTNQKDLFNMSRHSYNTNNHLLNNSVISKDNNDGLSIIKQLEIYRSAREQSALLEKSLSDHNLYLLARINKLQTEIDRSTDVITGIIDNYKKDFR